MPNLYLAQYAYYPALQCSVEEHLAYRELTPDDKDAIVPVFELSQRGTEGNLNTGITAIKESAGERPFILDLCKDYAPAPYEPKKASPEYKAKIPALKKAQAEYNGLLAQLLDPTDGFAEWRKLVAGFENCVPVIQHKDAHAEQKQILRQGTRLAKDGGCLAIRVNEETDPAIIESITQLIAVLDDDASLLVIVDCGQGRQRVSERAQFARKFASAVMAKIDAHQWSQIEFVCMASSFKETSKEGLYEYEGYDWAIWEEAVEGGYSMLYGDYAAHYRRTRTSTYVPAEWKPMVVFPLDTNWLVYRHENSKDFDGWIKASKAIMKHALYSPLPDAWGHSVLKRGAASDLAGIEYPRFWRAAKSNMHMHRQIRYAPTMLSGLPDDE